MNINHRIDNLNILIRKLKSIWRNRRKKNWTYRMHDYLSTETASSFETLKHRRWVLLIASAPSSILSCGVIVGPSRFKTPWAHHCHAFNMAQYSLKMPTYLGQSGTTIWWLHRSHIHPLHFSRFSARHCIRDFSLLYQCFAVKKTYAYFTQRWIKCTNPNTAAATSSRNNRHHRNSGSHSGSYTEFEQTMKISNY